MGRPSPGRSVAAQEVMVSSQSWEGKPALPGRPFPLGATLTHEGVNFSVFSEFGETALVCVFDEAGRETERYELLGHAGHLFYGLVPGLKAGARYGLRLTGPYAPARGMRFNPFKLLLDPYARALVGEVDYHGAIFGHHAQDKETLLDPRDDAASVPKALVVEDDFDWGDDRRPETPWSDTLIYELHVRGFSLRNPHVPEALRGTYAGLAHPASIEHLHGLGVTAVELLPVHSKLTEGFLRDKGLSDYWGYNALAYFAPERSYSSAHEPGAEVNEFKAMVKALHAAGIEVILDVVFNHTGEGNHMGPTLSFRGLDNYSYYHHDTKDKRYTLQFSGCGNSLNLGSAYPLRLVTDCLRYWAAEMHVDGFRFDLATALGRHWPTFEFDTGAAFFRAVHQDPLLCTLKLIAEPWDLGSRGYQMGNFPVLWSEWNAPFRDASRRFWRGDRLPPREIAYRLLGSPDVFRRSGRCARASINFVTCHDGFTLRDVLSYQEKHNQANGEGNHDGSDQDHSWNNGVEGETSDPGVRGRRELHQRNLLTTLLVARGVPMLLAGDEWGRTQGGNNNAYCQDNPISWLDWENGQQELRAFCARLARLRRTEGALRQDSFHRGEFLGDPRARDVAFFLPDGREMVGKDWEQPILQSLGCLFGGEEVRAEQRRPSPAGRSVLVLLNAGGEDVRFRLPGRQWGEDWQVAVDTTTAEAPPAVPLAAGSELTCRAHSMMVLRRPAATSEGGPP